MSSHLPFQPADDPQVGWRFFSERMVFFKILWGVVYLTVIALLCVSSLLLSFICAAAL